MPDNNIVKIINKILLQHMGLVGKFLLDLSYINSAQYSDVDRWLFFLSRNCQKNLSLMYSNPPAKLHRLPSYIFSCPSLKHLVFKNVAIKPCSSRYLGYLFLSFKIVLVELNSSEDYSSSHSAPLRKKLFVESCVGIHRLKIARSLDSLLEL